MAFSVRGILRYVGLGVLAILALIILAAAAVAWVGGRRLHQTFDVPAHVVDVATDPTAVAEGGRLAGFLGCTGCHTETLGGQVFFETPLGDRIVAPNLTRVAQDYSASELERAIRHGARPDGSSLIVMPSAMFTHLSDRDLGKVIGFLRSHPPAPDSLPERKLGLMARTFALLEDVQQASMIDQNAPHGTSPDSLDPSSPRSDTLALGRYLAHAGCPECHGLDLHGSQDGSTPDLRIAAAYSREQFFRLARQGLALDGTERELMTEIARGRIDHLSDDEIAALHVYLTTLAE